MAKSPSKKATKRDRHRLRERMIVDVLTPRVGPRRDGVPAEADIVEAVIREAWNATFTSRYGTEWPKADGDQGLGDASGSAFSILAPDFQTVACDVKEDAADRVRASVGVLACRFLRRLMGVPETFKSPKFPSSVESVEVIVKDKSLPVALRALAEDVAVADFGDVREFEVRCRDLLRAPLSVARGGRGGRALGRVAGQPGRRRGSLTDGSAASDLLHLIDGWPIDRRWTTSEARAVTRGKTFGHEASAKAIDSLLSGLATSGYLDRIKGSRPKAYTRTQLAHPFALIE